MNSNQNNPFPYQKSTHSYKSCIVIDIPSFLTDRGLSLRSDGTGTDSQEGNQLESFLIYQDILSTEIQNNSECMFICFYGKQRKFINEFVQYLTTNKLILHNLIMDSRLITIKYYLVTAIASELKIQILSNQKSFCDLFSELGISYDESLSTSFQLKISEGWGALHQISSQSFLTNINESLESNLGYTRDQEEIKTDEGALENQNSQFQSHISETKEDKILPPQNLNSNQDKYNMMTSELMFKFLNSELDKLKNRKIKCMKGVVKGADSFLKSIYNLWNQMKNQSKIDFQHPNSNREYFEQFLKILKDLYKHKWIQGEILSWIFDSNYSKIEEVSEIFRIQLNLKKCTEFIKKDKILMQKIAIIWNQQKSSQIKCWANNQSKIDSHPVDLNLKGKTTVSNNKQKSKKNQK